jgi:hypothetical protein
VEVVTVLQKVPLGTTPTPIAPAGRRSLWALLAFDVVTAAWMLALGDWFDRASGVTSVVTLGGHHQIVFWLSVCSFVGLLVAAVMSDGFTAADGLTRALTAIAGGVAVVATGGLLAFLAFLGGGVLLASMLGRAFIR